MATDEILIFTHIFRLPSEFYPRLTRDGSNVVAGGCRAAAPPGLRTTTRRDPGRVEYHYATAARSLHDGALGSGGIRFAQTTGYVMPCLQDETQDVGKVEDEIRGWQ